MTAPARCASFLLGLAAASVGIASPVRALEEVTSFGDNPGGLRMFEHTPAAPGPWPLVVVLHGCGQDQGFVEDAGFVALADAYGVALVAPVQAAANNTLRCFNWFLRDDASAAGGEAASIVQMAASMRGRYAIDETRVFVAGFSAGGAMAVALLAQKPETFAAGAVLAGIPSGCASTVDEAYACMGGSVVHTQAEWAGFVLDDRPAGVRWPRIWAGQGSADTTVAPGNLEALALQWSGVHGLSSSPDVTEDTDARRTERWTRDGTTVIEAVRFDGMAHAQPVDPASGCGRAGAFSADVGLCGAREAFAFFGLVPGREGPPGGGDDEGDAGTSVDHVEEDGHASGHGSNAPHAPASCAAASAGGPLALVAIFACSRRRRT